MNEQEEIGQLLFQVMSSEQPPQLSPHFDQQLTRRLRRDRLHVTDRYVVSGYAVLAVLVSMWWMRSESIPWPIIAGCAVLSAVVAAILSRALR